MPPFPLLGDSRPQTHLQSEPCLPALSQKQRWRFNPWHSTSTGLLAGCCRPPGRSLGRLCPVSRSLFANPPAQRAGANQRRPFPRAAAGQVSSWGVPREKLNPGGEPGHRLCARGARREPGTLLLVAPKPSAMLVTPESRCSGSQGAFPVPPH